MVLNNLMGVIDTSALGESATAIWGMVIALGANGAVSILNFFRAGFSGKKIKNLSDFTVIASKGFDFAKQEITTMSNQIKAEVVETIVKPLTQELQGLKEENTLLANLAVMALSVAPVPLDQKKEIFLALSKVSSITTETTKLLEANIAAGETARLNYENDNEKINDLIEES